MPSSLLRAGIAAVRDRSLGAVVALAGGAVAQDDTLGPLSPLTPGWKIAYPGGWAISSVTDVRRLLFWAAACVLVLVLLAVTNPTEASFRAHLTELAFRRHLAHIRSSDEPESAVDGAGTTTNGTPPVSSNGNGSGSGSGADTPPIAPFRFANHVAITLRTPNLCYRSYFLFAVAFAAAPGPPAFLSDPLPAKSSKHSAPQPEPSLAYLGVLGHWLVLGQVPSLLQWAWRVVRVGRRDKARKKSAALDRAGVLEMRAVLPKDESPPPGRGPTLVPKLLFKNESHKDLADLLPLHSAPSPLLPTGPYGSESRSRRGSIANAPASPTSPDGSPAPELTSPVLTALKVELAAAQNVLAELQAQLTTHDESVAAAQAHLQSTLDELRQRRKEDDAERQDLKAKAKTLEDQKRQAEGARRESEKRLKAVEAVRDGVQAKISTALSEIEELKGSMEGSEKHIKIVQDEGARHLIAARKTLDDKTRELADLENEVAQLESTNDTLHQQVRDAEDKLKTAEAAAEEARKMAPEEEMMLMAAAYEAAASETYLHGQRQNQADSQWASQAAAYMAEAGFPHLDQSYTARPTQTASTGYGHLARPPTNPPYRVPDKASAPAPPPINTAVATEKNMGDLSGFEGFGPGASRSLARPSTPRHNDDIRDHGSPSGPISSSFPDSWLPQGLVRSLEGDVTPLEGALGPLAMTPSDNEVMTVPAAHDDGSSPIDGDSGSDSGGDSPYWPHQQHSDPGHRRAAAPQNQRFFPNGTSGSTTTLPGNSGSIGHMQSRRWFSTSPSSENVSSAFNMFGPNMSNMPGVGSSDSLPLPAFESAFAPSASEKRALKWPLLNKGRWGSNNNGINGLDEITAGLQDRAGAGAFGASPPANGLSAEELFNRVPVSNSPPPPQQSGFGPWLSAHSHFGNSRGAANAGNASTVGNGHPAQGPSGSAALRDDEDDAELELPTERKPSFRFFSLRKGA